MARTNPWVGTQIAPNGRRYKIGEVPPTALEEVIPRDLTVIGEGKEGEVPVVVDGQVVWRPLSGVSVDGGTTGGGTGGTGGATGGTAVIAYAGNAYPKRTSVVSDTSKPGIWFGPVPPAVGGDYAVAGTDLWINAEGVS